jgi:hypothetical protein
MFITSSDPPPDDEGLPDPDDVGPNSPEPWGGR